MEFHKYQGTGNDFVIIDNRKLTVDLSVSQVKHICDRKFGVGADGLILLQNHVEHDFEMVYYNSDGKQSSMCGNGGRCLIAFANKLGIFSETCTFMAIDGLHHGKIESDLIYLKMMDVNQVEYGEGFYYMDTGSPHYVVVEDSLKELDIVSKAREIRYNGRFKDEGTNVNFLSTSQSRVRTYERGVEDETLSCGTGVTACALVMNDVDPERYSSSCSILTEGGQLSVSFDKKDRHSYENIWLIGPAVMVYSGEIDV